MVAALPPAGYQQVYTNMNVPGGGGFAGVAGKFMNSIPKGTFTKGLPIAGGLLTAAQGDVLGGVGMAGGGILGGMVGGPLGAVVGSTVGGPVLKGAAGLLGMGAQAVGGAPGAIANAAERGGLIGPYGQRPGLTQQDRNMMLEMGQVSNQNQLALNAGLMQQYDRMADGNLNRSMRQQNQLAMNLAGLGAMKGSFGLADRSMQEGGANFRAAVAAQNPYAGAGLGSAVNMSL
jgi:hypothetical protein